MSEYSANDINDARKRVEEMRKRARDVVDTNTNDTDEKTPLPPQQKASNNFGIGSILSSFGIDKLGNDSSLILALVLILSREGADNMLIMALLYILL